MSLRAISQLTGPHDQATLALFELGALLAAGDAVSPSLAESVLRLVCTALDADAAVVAMRSTDRYLVAHGVDARSIGVRPGQWLTLHDQSLSQSTCDPGGQQVLEAPFVASLVLNPPVGVRAALGVPLFRSSGEPFGRLLCLRSTHRPPSASELALLQLSGRFVMQVVEQQQMLRNDEEYRHLIERSRDPIVVVKNGTIVHVNKAATAAAADLRVLGVVGRPLSEFLSPDMHLLSRGRLALVEQGTAPLAPITFRLQLPSGETVQVESIPLPVLYEGQPAVQIRLRALSVDELSKDEWQYRALHDPLTGLPNRALFEDRLQQALRARQRGHAPVAVILIDLDGFKEINDTYGHDAGDDVLRSTGPRLRRLVRESDTVARLGGDEFALVLPGAGKADAEAVARKILGSLRRPYFIAGRRASIWASIGIAVAPEHGIDHETLMRRADLAMYSVKHQQSGVAVYGASPGDVDVTGAAGGMRNTRTRDGE